jgi:hypothetical protein
MPAGDLNNFLVPPVMYGLKLDALSETTRPTKSQVVSLINQGMWEMETRFLPRDLGNNRRSPGRMDRLLGQMDYEAETGAAGFCELPNTAHVTTANIAYYYLIERATVPMVEVQPGDITRLSTGIFAVTTTKPVFAWANSDTPNYYDGIKYLPAAGTPAIGYHFIQLSTQMLDDGTASETWPLDNDLMVETSDYALAKVLKGSPEETDRVLGGLMERMYEAVMGCLTGVAPMLQPSKGEVV